MAAGFCPRCGFERQEGMGFCARCGLDLSSMSPATSASSASPLHPDNEALAPESGTVQPRFSLARTEAGVVGLIAVAVVFAVWLVVQTFGGNGSGPAGVASSPSANPTQSVSASTPRQSRTPTPSRPTPQTDADAVIELAMTATGAWNKQVDTPVPLVTLRSFCHYGRVPSQPTQSFVTAVVINSDALADPEVWDVFYRDDDGPGSGSGTVILTHAAGFETYSYFWGPELSGSYATPGSTTVQADLLTVVIDVDMIDSALTNPQSVHLRATITCPAPN